MLARLTDADGRVTVPGFYDKVRELTDEEHAAYAEVPFDEDAWAERIERHADRWTASRATPCSSASRRARPSTSTACGAATPARARRRSSPPSPPPRSAPGWSPTRTIARSSELMVDHLQAHRAAHGARRGQGHPRRSSRRSRRSTTRAIAVAAAALRAGLRQGAALPSLRRVDPGGRRDGARARPAKT